MNRNTSLILLKSFFALFIVFTCNTSFANNTRAFQTGNFNNPGIWDNGVPSTSTLSLDDDVIIETGVTVTITSDVNLPTINLEIKSGGHLIIATTGNPITISFKNLTMGSGQSDTDIDFGTGSVTFTVMGDLKGGMQSIILHAPASKMTQKLILKGAHNALDEFSNLGASDGYSIVSYEGGDQNVIPSNSYATLLIGTGTKTLAGESFNKGTVTTVSKKLELNGQFKLDTLDLVYNGTNDSLVYNNGTVVTGWICTDNKGMLKCGNIINAQSFPVGDNTNMEIVILSTTDNTSGLEVGVRYNAAEPNITFPNTGTGTWILNANKSFNASILLGDPVPANAVYAAPSIVVSRTGTINSWTYLNTTKPAPQATAYQAKNVSFNSGKNYVAFISCPPLKISPSSLSIAIRNASYSQNNIVVSNGVAPYTLSNPSSLPSGFTASMVSQTAGTVQVTANPVPGKGSSYVVGFMITDAIGCTTPFSYTIAAIDPVSPNLYINPIPTKTYGDADFKLTAYSKNTTSTISYSVSPATCAQLTSGDSVHISCAGPVPNNTITVTATQLAGGIYKQESVTTSFVINKAPAKISISNNAFLPNTTTNITSRKNSDGTLTFTQLTGSDLATVTGSGQVTTFTNTSTFSVAVTIPATDKYTRFDSIYTFNIYPKKAAPWAINDSITIAMGQSTTINILDNDLGMTDTINSTLTDIDIENTGIQKKYYSTSLGTFTIDPDGTLNIRPFDGFIGTDKIGYTVTDEYGLTSDIAYLYITVEPPLQQLQLKANEVITPNNDGLNDALVIANTDLESENSIVISDENGNIIFEESNYRNDWKGTNQKGNKLIAGVYFYTFTEKTTGRVLQNYLQIAGY